MNTSLRASRAGLASATLLAAVALTACGTASSGSGGGAPASAPAASSSAPAASAGPSSASASAPASAAATGSSSSAAATSTPGASTPSGGPVPAGFAATSVTFVSPDEAFVLGTAPCAHAPCTSILATLDRGASWRGLPAPVVPLAMQSDAAGPAVWGIRFANPSDGFVFGNGLWETTDGGESWAPAASPSHSIVSLEVIDGQLLAIAADCTPNNGCGQTGTLERRPLAGGAWQAIGPVSTDAVIATQARVAAVLEGDGVIVTANGGISTVTHAGPCGTAGIEAPASVAVTGPDSLALLCAGNGAAGSVEKLVTSAASGASMLYYSADGGAQWSTAYYAGDGGLGFNDLGFTTTSDGVVVYGPVQSDSNTEGRPGRLLLTSNGGASWQAVSY